MLLPRHVPLLRRSFFAMHLPRHVPLLPRPFVGMDLPQLPRPFVGVYLPRHALDLRLRPAPLWRFLLLGSIAHFLSICGLCWCASPPKKKKGTTDLTKLERGVIDAMKNLNFSVNKIHKAIKRSRNAISKYLKKATYVKKRGRKPCTTAAQDAAFEAAYLRLRKQAAAVWEVPVGKARAEARKAVGVDFQMSLRTARRRLKKNGRTARGLRAKIPLTSDDRAARETWAQAMLAKPPTYWQKNVVFIDCKCFKVHTSEKQKLFARSRRVRFVYRMRSEGLLAECTKPGGKHYSSRSRDL